MVRTIAARKAAPSKSPPAPAELAVFFECHGYICAIDTASVERLLLADEVRCSPAPLDGCAACTSYDRRSGRLIGLAEVERRTVVVWDVGAMLELDPLSASIIVLRVTHGGAPLAVALRAGPCIAVRTLSHVTRLPADILRERPASMTGAFPAELLGKGSAGALLALQLEPAALFTRAELELSAALLAHPRGARRGP